MTVPSTPDPVAEIELGERGERVVADDRLRDEQLHLAAAVAQRGEDQLALLAAQHHPPGHRDAVRRSRCRARALRAAARTWPSVWVRSNRYGYGFVAGVAQCRRACRAAWPSRPPARCRSDLGRPVVGVGASVRVVDSQGHDGTASATCRRCESRGGSVAQRAIAATPRRHETSRPGASTPNDCTCSSSPRRCVAIAVPAARPPTIRDVDRRSRPAGGVAGRSDHGAERRRVDLPLRRRCRQAASSTPRSRGCSRRRRLGVRRPRVQHRPACGDAAAAYPSSSRTWPLGVVVLPDVRSRRCRVDAIGRGDGPRRLGDRSAPGHGRRWARPRPSITRCAGRRRASTSSPPTASIVRSPSVRWRPTPRSAAPRS